MRLSFCFLLTALCSFSSTYAANEHERRDVSLQIAPSSPDSFDLIPLGQLLGAVGAQVGDLVQADAELCLSGLIFDLLTGSCVDAPAPEESSSLQQPSEHPHPTSHHHAPTSVPLHQETPPSPAHPSASKVHDHSSHWEDASPTTEQLQASSELHLVHAPTTSSTASPHQPAHDQPHHQIQEEVPPPPAMPKEEEQPPMPKQEKHPPMPAPDHNACTCPPPPLTEKQDKHHHDDPQNRHHSDAHSHKEPVTHNADAPKQPHESKGHDVQDAEDELQIQRPNSDGSCSGHSKKHPTLWLCIDADFVIEHDLTIS